MKIAFVGKGGSGKSTVSALFIRYLITQNQALLAVDADINQHLAELIGAPLRPELALYYKDNPLLIRAYLRGTNARIQSPQRIVKTTPPGTGSQLVFITRTNPIVRDFSVPFAKNGHFMHVGTYGPESIGTSCYHSNLSVFENILSHTAPKNNQWLIADMVAGTDAFASALYLLFDVVFMVVEPTPESVGVFRQFSQLAKNVGTFDRVFAVGNKVIDQDDLAYLQNKLGDKLIAHIPHSAALRKNRQQGRPLVELSPELIASLDIVKQTAKKHRPDPNLQLKALHKLHKHFAAQDFTVAKHGDLTNQIDEAFTFV